MIPNCDDFCIWAFVTIDHLWQQIAPRFRHPGPKAKCSDSELITIALLSEGWGWDFETELLSHWRNFRHLFPVLPERSRFNRRRRNLMGAINAIRHLILGLLDPAQDQQCAIDSLPLPVIEFRKANFAPSRSYWGSQGASYGKVATTTKNQTIFGYKLQLLVTLSGVILDYELAGANEPDLKIGLEMLEGPVGLTVVAAKAYLDQTEQQRLKQEQDLTLLTLKRQNQKGRESAKLRKLHNHFRHIIETVNGQLACQFRLEINRAHSLWGLCSRLHTKMTGHTLSIYLNRLLGNPEFLQVKALAFPI